MILKGFPSFNILQFYKMSFVHFSIKHLLSASSQRKRSYPWASNVSRNNPSRSLLSYLLYRGKTWGSEEVKCSRTRARWYDQKAELFPTYPEFFLIPCCISLEFLSFRNTQSVETSVGIAGDIILTLNNSSHICWFLRSGPHLPPPLPTDIPLCAIF